MHNDFAMTLRISECPVPVYIIEASSANSLRRWTPLVRGTPLRFILPTGLSHKSHHELNANADSDGP